jgi:RNA polymerase subunit RPABC4/transcription elongation factor Spt4
LPFCQNCGKEVEEDARFCPKCGIPLQVEAGKGELFIENLDIPFPEAETLALDIDIEIGGRIKINPGEDKLLEGTIEYDIPEWKPRIETLGSLVKLRQGEGWRGRIWRTPSNRWDMRLGKAKPYSLDVKSGISHGEWNLGGLPLTELVFNTGVGDNIVTFKEENPMEMKRLRMTAGVGQLGAEGLLNARAQDMRISGGVGGTKLNFTGAELKHNTYIKIEGGVGGASVEVNEDTPTIARVQGLTDVSARGTFHRRSGSITNRVYVNEAYVDGASPRLEFNITMGIGGVGLRTV